MDVPFNGSEDTGGRRAVVNPAGDDKATSVVPAVRPDSESDETSEPEDGGKGVKSEGSEVVVDLGAGEAERDDEQEGAD